MSCDDDAPCFSWLQSSTPTPDERSLMQPLLYDSTPLYQHGQQHYTPYGLTHGQLNNQPPPPYRQSYQPQMQTHQYPPYRAPTQLPTARLSQCTYDHRPHYCMHGQPPPLNPGKLPVSIHTPSTALNLIEYTPSFQPGPSSSSSNNNNGAYRSPLPAGGQSQRPEPIHDWFYNPMESMTPFPPPILSNSLSTSVSSASLTSSVASSSDVIFMRSYTTTNGLQSSFARSPFPYSSYQLHVHDVPRKSRIETQVKLKLELVDLAGPGMTNGDSAGVSGFGHGMPVTKWSFIEVPKTASVKQKNRGVYEPDPSTVLTLQASIYCATNPNFTNQIVPCCEACQSRERKRNSKKSIPSNGKKSNTPSNNPSKNPTPATSDAEVYGPQSAQNGSGSYWSLNRNGVGNGSDGMEDDYVSPIDFTCYQMVDFSSGSVPLSFRIVCYCRHYREKVGFCILLTLKDNFGRTVGEVKTTPIMITDDHKSVQKLTPAHTADEEEVDSFAASTRRRNKRIVPERIKHEDIDEADENVGVGAIRTKRSTRTSTLTRASGMSKLASASSAPPSVASASGNISGTSGASGSGPGPGPAIATTTNGYNRRESQGGYAHRQTQSQSYTQSESPLATTAPSSPSAGFSPPPTGIPGDGTKNEMDASAWAGFPVFSSPTTGFPDANMSAALASMALVPQAPMPPPPNPYPHITRVIPNSGSMLGGIEVTLFGANFSRESLAHAAIAFGSNFVTFGNDGNAQVWSETVLICTLPPSAMLGAVEVSLLGVQTVSGMQSGSALIFTYTEDGEKYLMMQALRMLGWQNSEQIQDPRNVALNILSNAAPAQNMTGLMGMEDPAGTDLSHLFHGLRSNVDGNTLAQRQPPSKLEQLVLNVLRSAQHPVTGTISHISTPDPFTKTGQTLLHIASALGFYRLVHALIGWGAKVDVQDKNGFSPVHFACLYGRLECLNILVRTGRAHLEGKDVQGRSPIDVCGTKEVKELVEELEEEVETRRRRSRAPSEIESGGEGDDEGILSSSEADEDDEDDFRPAKISGAEHPQSVSRRISRVNSVASIVSNRRISRSSTPFAPESMMIPVAPLHPTSTSASAHPPSTTWGLPIPRNIPRPNIAMPWPMQFPANWQFPNVPAMPQFARRRSGQPDSPDSPKDEKERMFWMMWMDAVRGQWGLLQAQQQQQQQQQTLASELDPPPQYSPAEAASQTAPQEKQSTSSAIGTPAVPTMLEEPPSPLTLDSPYSVGLAVPGTFKMHAHTGSTIRPRQHLSYRRRSEFVETPLEAVQSSSSKVIVKRREKKQQDKMLYYFWIPVLLLVLAWASYKYFATLYRLLRPTQTVEFTGPQGITIEV